ncbi:alpha/beta hydrolase [Sphingomonas sp. AR_OL41]|uniref:alpha/beta fold hydrolase n=1 Tax=Sphingomonas sp. AR_OL41 TaxID=3042729 RepID=UPI0024810AC5|nr:alpha/beta hydrolase [Sphingomonas sp. AR_OL41]MDH7971663.1 alpha/beta hydrolase [Sphingomonas sp. AR_OL41]
MVSPTLYRRAIPAGARVSRWTGPDGWNFRRFDWPAEGTPRGSILFQAGRGDLFEKYLEAIAHWHGQGWSITSLDWRGQGGSGRVSSDPHVGDIDDFATFVSDIRAFWATWTPQAAGPQVVMAHSMGGHIVLRALVEQAITPVAAVLIAPMLGLHSPIGAALGERLARLLGGVGNSSRAAWKSNEGPAMRETRLALLTHDPSRYEDELFWQQSDPALVLGPPSWRWVMQAFASTRLLRADPRLKAMRVPVLMLVADADQLVDPKAALTVAAKLPDVRVVRFGKEAAHEVLREADSVRNRAIGEIDLFLAARAQRG